MYGLLFETSQLNTFIKLMLTPKSYAKKHQKLQFEVCVVDFCDSQVGLVFLKD